MEDVDGSFMRRFSPEISGKGVHFVAAALSAYNEATMIGPNKRRSEAGNGSTRNQKSAAQAVLVRRPMTYRGRPSIANCWPTSRNSSEQPNKLPHVAQINHG